MSQTLSINNFSALNIQSITSLSASFDAGVTVLTVENTANFSADDFVVLGTLSGEGSELVTIDSVTDATNMSTDNVTVLPHSQFEPVTKLLGEKIRLYRAANVDGTIPDIDSFLLLHTLDISVDQGSTTYTDADGSSDYWYRFTYYNSVNNNETNLADSTAARGGGYGNYCSIEAIRQQAGLANNRWITDSQIDTKRQAAQDEINGALVGLYTLPFSNPVPARIVDLATRIAAGLVLTHPWGGRFVSTGSEGSDMLTKARSELTDLQSKAKVLVDSGGTSLAIAGANGFRMYPNTTTADLDWADGGRGFKTTDRY